MCRCSVLLEQKYTMDHWQQSFQQQFITVTVAAAINLRARIHEHQTREQPSFETATDDLQKVGRHARFGWQRRHMAVVSATYMQSFWMLTSGASVKFFASLMMCTASDRNWRNNFCRILPLWVPGLGASWNQHLSQQLKLVPSCMIARSINNK